MDSMQNYSLDAKSLGAYNPSPLKSIIIYENVYILDRVRIHKVQVPKYGISIYRADIT